MIRRQLDITSYNNSLFLFGPRQVGKTWLIKNTLTPELYINLLNNEDYSRYSKSPSLFPKEVRAVKNTGPCQIVIDEVQRCPFLLDEIQLAMDENPNVQFILTGSSARKLKRAGVNLLGGRAITLHLHPFTAGELGERFSLAEALRFGALPKISLSENISEKMRLLKSYVEIYLKEEIQQEALVRNVPAFSKFLDLAAFENGNIINFKNISREVGSGAKTIKEYFQILEDTLIGFFLHPYVKSHRERIIAHPKFYLFDTGVVRALKGELSSELVEGSPPYGSVFEHFVILEIKKVLDYREREARISFFRTSDGAEVDLILEIGKNLFAVEIKSSNTPSISEVRGLRSFISDHKFTRAVCLCRTERPYLDGKIEFLNWNAFLNEI